jgi:hypothetical protein
MRNVSYEFQENNPQHITIPLQPSCDFSLQTLRLKTTHNFPKISKLLPSTKTTTPKT